MAVKAAARAELCRLRREIAAIEGRLAADERLPLAPPGAAPSAAAGQGGAALRLVRPKPPDAAPALPADKSRARLPFGIPALDAMTGGGLPLAALTEIRAGESRDGGAAGGFALALVARLAAAGRAPAVLWISAADARRETGGLYAPGLAALGLDPAGVVQVTVRTGSEALWAFEAALSCPALGAAICELRQVALDLSATRRMALRARASGVAGFLVRLGQPVPEPSAAALRFAVRPAPAGAIGGFPGVGRMAWRLALEKNRLGPTGTFILEWNAYERSFAERPDGWDAGRRAAHPEPLPAASPDRPPLPPAPLAALRRAS
jgi:protein ImuA